MSPLTANRPITPGQALLTCAHAGFTALMCAAMCAVAIVARAPAAVVPLIALACTTLPVMMCWRVPAAFEVLWARRRADASAVAELRRDLDALPEADHPLGC